MKTEEKKRSLTGLHTLNNTGQVEGKFKTITLLLLLHGNQLLKAAGANLSTSKNMVGQTLLHAAVETAQETTVKFLLEEKLPADVKDGYGRTPLDVARMLKYTDIAKLLETYFTQQK